MLSRNMGFIKVPHFSMCSQVRIKSAITENRLDGSYDLATVKQFSSLRGRGSYQHTAAKLWKSTRS